MIRILIAVAMLFAGARPAVASCVRDAQGPCYWFWNVETVFVAKVLDKVVLRNHAADEAPPPGMVWLADNYRLQVRVVEAFRGVKAGAVITLFASDAMCDGVDAEDGAELFIYASRNTSGELWARGGDSKELEEADADLAYARSVNAGGPSALFYGDVFQREDHSGGPDDFSPMKGVRIRVRGGSFEAETETDEEGNYSLTLPGAGKYSAEVIPPPGFANRFGDGPIAFELKDGRACFHDAFQMQLNGRIHGRVVDDKGEPVSNLVIQDGAEKRSAKTDANGAFDLGPLEEGIYSIAMITGSHSRRFADAGPATVVGGRATFLPPVTLPAGLDLVTLSVNVTVPEDAGEASILLTAKDGRNELGEPIPLKSGTIHFLVERDVSFEVVAATQTHEAKAVTQTSSPLTEVTLTLRPQKTPQ